MRGDPQAERVYLAEHSIDPGAQLHAADQVHRYVASITMSPWWLEHGWPAVKVTTPRGERAWGGRLESGSWYVCLPGWRTADLEAEAGRAMRAGAPVTNWPWAWRELLICHELTHVRQLHDLDGRHRPAAHGGAFCGLYLETVDAVMGPLAAWRLGRAFDRQAVAVGERPEFHGEPCGPDALASAAWNPYRPHRAPLLPTPAILQDALL